MLILFLPNYFQLQLGLSTDRRCMVLKVAQNAVDIWSMIHQTMPEKAKSLQNYGCCGAQNLDVHAANLGAPIDEVDRAINARKNCIKCAILKFNQEATSYAYNSNHCENDFGTARRAFCECDKEFIEKVLKYDTHTHNPQRCQYRSGADESTGECCQTKSGSFQLYNSYLFTCCDGVVTSIGNCI